MLEECALPDCNKKGKNACSGCVKEFYCSAECQKADWKAHKIACNLIKLMPVAVLPSFRDVCIVIDSVMKLTDAQIAKLGSKKYVGLIDNSIKFVNHQAGKRVECKATYERANGDLIDAWVVGALSSSLSF
jgi:hypothetical protein